MFITPILFLSTSCSRWLMDSLDATCSETESNCAQNCARYVTVSVSTRYRCVLVTLHGFGSEWKCNKLSDQTRESLLSLLFLLFRCVLVTMFLFFSSVLTTLRTQRPATVRATTSYQTQKTRKPRASPM